MPSPFPGMDPFLESLQLWPDVHHGLISHIQMALAPMLRPHYVARVELRTYVSDEDDPGREVLIPDLRVEVGEQPQKTKRRKSAAAAAIDEPLTVALLVDDEIKEARVEILHRQSQSLVGAIEVLSPANKVRGSRGRQSFMDKRRDILTGPVHWVEIDLLRGGTPSVTRPRFVNCDYRILVSPGLEHHRARFWPRSLRQPLPLIGIPLRGQDEDIPLDLGAVLRQSYDDAAYDLSIDYSKEPQPALKKEDRAWAHDLLRDKGLRK